MAEADGEDVEEVGRCFGNIFSRIGSGIGACCVSLGRSLRFRRRHYIEDFDEPELPVIGINTDDLSVPSIHGPERHQRPLTLTARTRTKPRTPTLIAIQLALGEIDKPEKVDSSARGVRLGAVGDDVVSRQAGTDTGPVLPCKPSCEEIEEEVFDVESFDDLDVSK